MSFACEGTETKKERETLAMISGRLEKPGEQVNAIHAKSMDVGGRLNGQKPPEVDDAKEPGISDGWIGSTLAHIRRIESQAAKAEYELDEAVASLNTIT